SERFPKVSGIVIYMTYYHKAENPVLMKRTVNFFPTSYAYFKIECIVKGCEGGGFDLKRVVTGQIKNHKKLLKGEIICKGKNGDTVSCHSNISYEINIKYNRSSK
ncbi:MAG: hypothetical protein KAJ34_08395, partial [Thermodesulfovibrionia bacterium]|nr:hypothetical protein [Thermodesulfovibrionia bacterium]